MTDRENYIENAPPIGTGRREVGDGLQVPNDD